MNKSEKTYRSEDGTLMVYCPDCQKFLPSTDFYTDNSRYTGFNRVCIEHHKLMVRKQSTARSIKTKMANEYLKEAQTLEELEQLILEHLKPVTLEAVDTGKIRIHPCSICGSIRFLKPKYWSFKRPYEVDWRCEEHYHLPLKRVIKRGKFMHV